MSLAELHESQKRLKQAINGTDGSSNGPNSTESATPSASAAASSDAAGTGSKVDNGGVKIVTTPAALMRLRHAQHIIRRISARLPLRYVQRMAALKCVLLSSVSTQ